MSSVNSGPATTGWTIEQWLAAYRGGQRPEALLGSLLARLQSGDRDPAWIEPGCPERLARELESLAKRLAAVGGDMSRLPLYGVPFAVKDNIDAAGWPTTAACAAFAYEAADDAEVVRRLRAAGAVLLGKTNLDQFATGLVGTRSPYGAVPNTFDPAYVSGGSSSGSASVVARGIVPFSLGTDTAGSGRVPAGFNNIVGLKPTKGWLSTRGVVPACRTQDCVSIFALTVADAERVAQAAGGYDAGDPYSRPMPDASGARQRRLPARPRLAVPAQPEFYRDAAARAAFQASLDHLAALGASLHPIDFSPFSELASLLYQGPWVAERFAVVEALWREQPQAIHPVVRGIVEQAANHDAVDAFRAEYRRAGLARLVQETLAGFDALVVPTTPSIYTIAQLQADPVELNSRLGIYTNFANLADLCALALPGPMRSDGLPAGITLIAPAWHDLALAEYGRRWQAAQDLPLGATGLPVPAAQETDRAAAQPQAAAPQASAASQTVTLAVVGAHLRGMPLNHQLTSRGARFIEQTLSDGNYRLYALAGTVPPKPGLLRTSNGQAIALELWELDSRAFGEFVAEVPAPLGIGTVVLADGRAVKGFICEPAGLEGAQDITAFGGWRAYLARSTSTTA